MRTSRRNGKERVFSGIRCVKEVVAGRDIHSCERLEVSALLFAHFGEELMAKFRITRREPPREVPLEDASDETGRANSPSG
jgi:hypothetical protein